MKGEKMKKTIVIMLMLALFAGCDESKPQSDSGVQKAQANVTVQASGLTVEQENVKRRLELESVPGAIKHLYVISAYSGQVIIYSTVKGKVTSSGKRLTPSTVNKRINSGLEVHDGARVNIGGDRYTTSEVLQDDGTYGTSIPYLYWFDVNDRYHQHYVSGGQIIHIGDQPLQVKDVIINMEVVTDG
jgi:hypothetical protein